MEKLNLNMFPLIKVATAQCKSVQNNLEKTVNHILKNLEWAGKNNVDILCFPECYLTGYYSDKEVIKENAISLSSEAFEKILNQLKDFKTTIILGLIEEENNNIYNAAVVIEKGKLVGKYHKIHLNEKKYKAGNEYHVFKKNDITYGIQICNDANYPESALKLKEKGAQIIFYPLNNKLPIKIADEWKEKSIENLVSIARENTCWVVSSDVVYQDEKELSYGCTLIINPKGEIIKGIENFKEGIIYT